MPWQKIRIVFLLVLLPVVAGCMDIPEHSVCASGLICPPHLHCAAHQDICIEGPCGDGVVDAHAGETCDDGNILPGDGCSRECISEGLCGNSVIDAGEECDEGGQDTATCNRDCTVPVCGDGLWNPKAGEGCDDGSRGNLSVCNNCRLPARLALGGAHTCALGGDGTVRCWGNGAAGQLGYGNTNNIGDDETPALVGSLDVGGSVIEVATGESHTCALLSTGAVRCWGGGDKGQLGYGTQNSILQSSLAGEVPVGTAIQIAAGWNHTCALLDSGTVRCWGKGTYGQLGYGNTHNLGDDEALVSVADVDVGGLVIRLAAGGNHTCALLERGVVRCWGHGTYGQLGYGNREDIGDNETPASAGDVDVGGPVIQIAAGGNRTCALLTSGAVRCWGRGEYGQLGYGGQDNIGDDETPASAGDVRVAGDVMQLSLGGEHTCALYRTGEVRCWGSSRYGQLGYGNERDAESPFWNAVIDVGDEVIELAAGNWHTCALLVSQGIRCWGRGDHGQLGYGNTTHIGNNEPPSRAGNVPYR